MVQVLIHGMKGMQSGEGKRRKGALYIDKIAVIWSIICEWFEDLRVMARAKRTTCAISSARVVKMATLCLFMDHTSTPRTSFHAPSAARPANAARPTIALTSRPVNAGHSLRITAQTTNVRPSRR